MANYVNYQDGEQTQWIKQESHMGIICRSKEEEAKEKNEYYNEGKAKNVYYNDSWGQELGLPGEMTDSPSPAHSTDSIYDLASNSATTDSDGYEIPVSTIDRLNKLNSGTKLSENADRKWGKGQTGDLRRQSTNPLPEARVKRHDVGAVGKKAKPVPTKRKTKSAFQDSTYSLAKSDSSLDSIDISSSPSQNPKKTLSRQKVIYQVKGGSGQLHANAKEPRKRSRDRKAPKQDLEPESHGVPLAQKEVVQRSKEQKSEDRFRHTRNNSTTSDNFEDALEYLPDDWAPAKLKNKEKSQISHAAGSGRSKVIDPVTGGNYEDAWDLNPRLEAKLSSLKLMHPRPEKVAESLNEGNYQDPWDLSRKQQELEEKIQQATKGRDGRGSGRASSFARSSRERPQDGCDIRRSASQVLQSTRDTESPGHPLRLSCSLRSAPGCLGGPVNSTDCLQNQEWYHGNILRTDAEDMLRVCKEGSYLVRDSSDRCHYTLSIKSSSQIIHIQIEQNVTLDGSMRYILGHHSRAFSTVPSMIQHYNSHPVPIKGAQHMKLLYSVPHS